MSFDELKISDLKKIAEDFGVDIESIKAKKDIINAIEEEGVTWSVYKQTQQNMEEVEDMTEEKPVKAKEIKGDEVLVRMTRNNFRYDTNGFTFTKDHPYVAMPAGKAQEIFDKEEGFRLATPREVQEYYS